MDFDHDLEQRLRDERPTMSNLERDGLRRRVGTGAGASRSRLGSMAVTACLALGIVVSGAGTGMAVSGLSSGGRQVTVAYPTDTVGGAGGGGTPVPTNTTTQQANPPVGGQGDPTTTDDSTSTDDNTSTNDNTSTDETGPNDGGVADAGTSSGDPARGSQQLAATASDTGSQLPFTGFSAIPVLLVGMALLGTGAVLRRRTSRN